jgi:hypothetical protein
MLGWHIIIYRKHGKGSIWDEHTISDWITGPSGTDWLDRLVEAGLAQMTEHNSGYPLKYIGRAKDLLPHLTSQPTPHSGPDIIGDDYFMPTGWRGTIKIKEHLVSECLESNEEIIVAAWDQS